MYLGLQNASHSVLGVRESNWGRFSQEGERSGTTGGERVRMLTWKTQGRP